MHIIQLYKTHINPDATSIEIHNFMKNFDIGKPYIPHYDEETRLQIEKDMMAKTEIAKQHILKNSKLKLD